MNKVIAKDFRPTKEFKLPLSTIVLTCYPSLLVGDMSDLKIGADDLGSNLAVIVKIIKEWNFYENESDEKPLPITVENIKRLPSTDFESFVAQLQAFTAEQKKSSETSQ